MNLYNNVRDTMLLVCSGDKYLINLIIIHKTLKHFDKLFVFQQFCLLRRSVLTGQ